MNLNTLDIENFLSIDDASLNFESINFICGSNGRGKTSVRHALEWMLSGAARMVKGSKLGEKNLIRDADGADHCEVEGHFRDGNIRRRRTFKTSSSLYFTYRGIKQPEQREDPTKTDIQKAIYDKLNLNGSAVHFLLDGEDYISLSSDDRRSELFRLFGGTDADAIESAIEETDLSDRAIEHVRESLEETDTIDGLIDRYVEIRREAKREKKSASDALDDLSKVEIVTFEVDDDVRELPYEKAVHDRDEKLAPKLDEVTDEISEMQSKGLNFNLNDSADELSDELEAVENKLDDAPGTDKIEGKISEKRAELTQAKKRKEMADAGEGQCVFDDSEPCPVDDETLENFSNDIQETIDSIEDDLDKLQTNQKKINKLKNKKSKLEGRLESLPDEDQRERFNELKEKKDNLEVAIKAIDDAERTNEKIEEHTKTVEKQQKRIDRVNDIIDALESIKGDLIPMDEYQDILNEAGDILEVDLDITSEGDITLDGRPPVFLSSSEQIRLQYAHQFALCGLTDSGVLSLDYLEELDKQNRRKFLKMIDHFEGDYETLIVLIARQLGEPPLDSNLINMDDILA